MSNKNKQRAEEVGRGFFGGSKKDGEIFAVSEGEANANPHESSGSGKHSDGWRVTNKGGNVSASKEHVPED